MANAHLPVVVRIELYEAVGYDAATTSLVPTRPLRDVMRPQGPPFLYLFREAWVYAQLTGPAGTYDLSAECRLSRTPFVLTKLPELRLPAGRVVEVAFRFQQLPLPLAGLYEFLLSADGQPLQPTAQLVVR